MVYLLLAILSSALISVIMRFSESRISGKLSMLAMNYLMCMVLAGAYTGVGNLFPRAEGIGRTAVMGVIGGVLYLVSFILLQLNVRKNGVVLSSVFMKLGLLVPIVLSVCFFGEKPQLLQILGFCIAVAGIVLINFEREQTSMKFKAGLILLLVLGGGADGMSKIHEELGSSALSDQFLFYIFGVALLLCLGLVLFRKERLGGKEVLFGLLIGIPNYFSSRFLLLSLRELPAVIAYPTFSVGTIVVVTLAGLFLFKERLGKRQWVAMAAILAALVLLNI